MLTPKPLVERLGINSGVLKSMATAIDGMVTASEYGDTKTAAEAATCAATASAVALADANCPTKVVSASVKQACQPNLETRYQKAAAKTSSASATQSISAVNGDEDCCEIARTNTSLINALSIRVDAAEESIATNTANINTLLPDYIYGELARIDDGTSAQTLAIEVPFNGVVTGLIAKTSGGTVDAEVQILTGAATIQATNTLSIDNTGYKTATSTANNAFVVGYAIQLQFFSASSVEDLQFQMNFSKTL